MISFRDGHAICSCGDYLVFESEFLFFYDNGSIRSRFYCPCCFARFFVDFATSSFEVDNASS